MTDVERMMLAAGAIGVAALARAGTGATSGGGYLSVLGAQQEWARREWGNLDSQAWANERNAPWADERALPAEDVIAPRISWDYAREIDRYYQGEYQRALLETWHNKRAWEGVSVAAKEWAAVMRRIGIRESSGGGLLVASDTVAFWDATGALSAALERLRLAPTIAEETWAGLVGLTARGAQAVTGGVFEIGAALVRGFVGEAWPVLLVGGVAWWAVSR